MFRWLLYSPRRAIGAAIAAAFVLAMAFAIGTGVSLAKLPAATPSPASQPTSTETASQPTGSSTADASSASRDGALSFITAWLSADSNTAAWADRMRPYATKRLLDLTVLTDPALVPATKVKTAQTVTSTQTISGVAITLDNGVTVAVTVIASGGHWLADDLRPIGT